MMRRQCICICNLAVDLSRPTTCRINTDTIATHVSCCTATHDRTSGVVLQPLHRAAMQQGVLDAVGKYLPYVAPWKSTIAHANNHMGMWIGGRQRVQTGTYDSEYCK